MKSDSKKRRILILGAGGMLGHKLCQLYENKYDIFYTVRADFEKYEKFDIFKKNKMIEGVDVLNFEKITNVIEKVSPDVLINCVGIIKQLKEANDPILSIKINSLLPHQLSNICRKINTRFIHISTDCVFNGKKGMYTEDSSSDAEDLYGRTKFLGEVDVEGNLTLRTSIIGRELETENGLIEWFLNNKNSKISGFKKAIYTGFTTMALSKVISDIIDNRLDVSGMWQVSSDPIDKYELLCLVKDIFNLNVEIDMDTKFALDRSLDSSHFRNKTGFVPPTWEDMIKEMANDLTPYSQWH